MKAQLRTKAWGTAVLAAALAMGGGACIRGQSGPLVKVFLLEGSVRAVPWDKKDVHVHPEGAMKIVREGSDVFLTGTGPGGTLQGEGADGITVFVPPSTGVSIRTVSGAISAERLRGNVRLRSVSGDVAVRACVGDLRATSVSGTVSVRDSRGDMKLRSVSGPVTVNHGTAQRLRASTVSGALRLAGVALDRGKLRTLSGEIIVEARRVTSGLHVKTFSGDAYVTWPRETGVVVDADTRSGGILLGPPRGGKPKTRVVETLGRGGSKLVFRSFSGTLRVRASK